MRVSRPRSRIARSSNKRPKPVSFRSTRRNLWVLRRAIGRRSWRFALCRRWFRSPATRPARLSTAIRIRSPTLPMFGHLPVTLLRAIRTGSWLAPEALTSARGLWRYSAICCVVAASLLLAAFAAHAARQALRHPAIRGDEAATRQLPYPRLEFPLEISGSQYAPLAWSDIAGWREDDHLQAFKAFRTSCKPIAAQEASTTSSKALGTSLRDPCRMARAADITDGATARAFFEENFLPLRISRLGEDAGFVTGYYEPVINGSRTQTDVYTVPVYRRPSNLFVRGFNQSSTGLPNGGQVFRKIGRRKLVPYYDRGEIEDGKIAGRGLEICWLKNQTDLLFAQIQGSARVHLEDGT